MTDGKAPTSIGPAALKAFAHPLRMRLYGELVNRGAATASQLGRALGESSGQTSYHLRQLEKHGFVEDDPGHGGGRERWWRARGFALSEPELIRDPATSAAALAVMHQAVADRTSTLAAWLGSIDPAQVNAMPGFLSSTTLWLTEQEAETLAEELSAVFERAVSPYRGREAAPPAGSGRVRLHLDVLPLPRTAE
ncbi:winged helix-turn-helix domain-containing protein [Serinibacter salmoneus]|uniref:Helix-turn-helix protein n=1 Tax=Serinibacter salmoneus TaxID=556530 RepID=A0A2A9D2B6_9MICO|nr:helix-turn-helix domain-containing protein [Serinibacter salmoneus]PFG20814.1 helix-turn-helix protein [Serinibacter salmoneus]